MKTYKIIIHEVGPRDGLQVEKTIVPLKEKIAWVDGIKNSGIDIIQLGSFVNPKAVPQLAEIGRESWRERVFRAVYKSGGGVSV